jgi:hypothetical protein
MPFVLFFWMIGWSLYYWGENRDSNGGRGKRVRYPFEDDLRILVDWYVENQAASIAK